MMHSQEVDERFVIPQDRFDNPAYIEQRLLTIPEENHGSMRSTLRSIYLTDGPTNFAPKRFAAAKNHLEPAELVLARWLKTRTNGSLRSRYGANALREARAARYRCRDCQFPDIRVLHLDHVKGLEFREFSCLCAKCHNIKSRKTDWDGKKRYRLDEPGFPLT